MRRRQHRENKLRRRLRKLESELGEPLEPGDRVERLFLEYSTLSTDERTTLLRRIATVEKLRSGGNGQGY